MPVLSIFCAMLGASAPSSSALRSMSEICRLSYVLLSLAEEKQTDERLILVQFGFAFLGRGERFASEKFLS